MPDFSAYLDWNEAGDLETWYRGAQRSAGVAFMIGHRGASVVLTRGTNTKLDAQNVLVVPATYGTSQLKADTGQSDQQSVVIIAMPDADIENGDRFSWNATPSGRLNYTVKHVDRSLTGMIQATTEEIQ